MNLCHSWPLPSALTICSFYSELNFSLFFFLQFISKLSVTSTINNYGWHLTYSDKEYMFTFHMWQSIEFSLLRGHLSFMVRHPSISWHDCHLATAESGVWITDWFLRELCWIWYLTSYHLIPFVYVSEKISFVPHLHKNPINFSSLLSLGKFWRHEIRGRFIT